MAEGRSKTRVLGSPSPSALPVRPSSRCSASDPFDRDITSPIPPINVITATPAKIEISSESFMRWTRSIRGSILERDAPTDGFPRDAIAHVLRGPTNIGPMAAGDGLAPAATVEVDSRFSLPFPGFDRALPGSVAPGADHFSLEGWILPERSIHMGTLGHGPLVVARSQRKSFFLHIPPRIGEHG